MGPGSRGQIAILPSCDFTSTASQHEAPSTDLNLYEQVEATMLPPTGVANQRLPVTARRSHESFPISVFPPEQVHLEPISVRAICEMSDVREDVSIILDSGTGATVIPSKFVSFGSLAEVAGELRHCQGNVIDTCGERAFSFVVHTQWMASASFSESLVICQMPCPVRCFGLAVCFNMVGQGFA